MKKRILVCAVALLMLLPLLCACKTEETGTPSEGSVSGDAPFGLAKKDWGGMTLKVVSNRSDDKDAYINYEITYDAAGEERVSTAVLSLIHI